MGWECIMNAVDFVDTPNLSLFLKKKKKFEYLSL